MLDMSKEQIIAHYKRIGKPIPKEFIDKPIEEQKKLQKYNSKITYIDGVCFRSHKEAAKYQELKLRLMAGEIKAFCLQPKFILVEGNEEEKAITYSADFIVINPDDTADVIDTKGYESAQWKRTYKQFRLKYPLLELKVIK